MFLHRAGHEARTVYKRDERNVEGVGETDEASELVRGINVDHACKVERLLRYHADHLPVQSGKADDGVSCKMLMHFKKRIVIEDAMNNFLHVVGNVGIGGDEGVEGGIHAVRVIRWNQAGGRFGVVCGQIADQFASQVDRVVFILRSKVSHAADRVVSHRAAQCFEIDLFAGHGLDHFGSGDEHVARAFGHDHKIGESG